MSPELTVLMAVRNGGTFLPTAVESILRQSYRNFRFLVVDDASTDQTRERLREYASQDHLTSGSRQRKAPGSPGWMRMIILIPPG